MSSIYFDGGKVATWDPSSEELLAWLNYQASLGRIVSTASPPAPAFRVVAAQGGTYGNKIEITTAPAAPPGDADNVDVTVSVTDRYEDVKVSELAALLGTAAPAGGGDAVKGTEPGLLHVSENPNGAPEPGLGIIDDTTKGVWELGTGGSTVKLVPRNPGADFDKGEAEVRVEGGAPGRFTLVVTWSATAADVAAANLDTNAFKDTFKLLVKIEAPDTGVFRLPRAGTSALGGGSDPAAAIPAKALLLADD